MANSNRQQRQRQQQRSQRPASNPSAASGGSKSSASTSAKAASPSSSRLAEVRERSGVAPRAQQTRRRYYRPPWWRRNLGVLSTVAVVLVLVIVFIAFARAQNKAQSVGIGDPVPQTVMSQVTGVSSKTAAAVGSGTAQANFHGTPANTTLLTANGKPVVVYVGADWCPYCAATRWSMVVALSRFGSFKNLTLMKSSSSDTLPNTATFSFQNATYTSTYISLNATETADRNNNPLATPDAAAKNSFGTFNVAPYTTSAGGIPFISFGDQYVTTEAIYIPTMLQNLSWQQIASQLNDPNSDVSKAIVGGANQQTAAICKLTNNQPGNVCNASYIQQIEASLPARQ